MSIQRLRQGLLASFLSMALLASACGGVDPRQEDRVIRQVASDYFQSSLEGNGLKACATLTEEGQRKLIENLRSSLPTPAEDCPSSVTLYRKTLLPEAQQVMEENWKLIVQKGKLRVQDNRAELRTPVGEILGFAKEDEAWKLLAPPILN